MEKENYLADLSELGLKKREIKVYLALLELNKASVRQIAHKTQLERTSLYDILRRLKTAGLISESFIKNKRRFLAQPPTRLKEKLEFNLKKLDQILPTLESIYNQNIIKPTVEYFEGREGVKTVLEKTLTASDGKLLGILSMSDLFEFLDKEYMDDYVSRRIKRKVNLWVIRSKTKDVNNYWETDPSALRELRHAPTRLIFSMTQYVFDDRVALISSRQEGFGMVIQSKEFAANQRNLFESLWKVSKPESDKRR